jgi:hypothetical protein
MQFTEKNRNKDIDQITHDKKRKKNLLELINRIKQADAYSCLQLT